MAISFADFLNALGAKPTGSNGQYEASCPVAGHGRGRGDLDESLTIGVRDGKVLVRCHGNCGQDRLLDTLWQREMWPVEVDPAFAARIEAASAQFELPPELLKFDAKVISAKELETEHYLWSRRLDLDDLQDIQHHPNAYHKASGTYWPCMVCAVRDDDNNLRGLHRTFLSHDNPPTKAPVKKPRLFYPGGQYAGNSIHLAPAAAVMSIAEGVETCASAMRILDLPGWAAGGDEFMSLIILPDIVEEIVIAADNDAPGLKAAIELARRLQREGRQARIVKPGTCDDFNSLLMQRQGLSEPVRAWAAQGRRP